MNEKPKLGTIDSALVNCVSLLSAVTAQRFEDLAGWLDLYYQIRRWWEISQGKETDPQLIRKDDLLPILDTAVREAMRGTAMKAAEAVATKKKPRQPKRPEPERQEPEKAEEETAPSEATRPGPWTLYKRKVFAQLQKAREDGYTINQIAEASGGVLSVGRVIAAINASPLRQEEWKALEGALAAVMLLQIPAEKAAGA